MWVKVLLLILLLLTINILELEEIHDTCCKIEKKKKEAYIREKGDVIQGCAIITRLLLLFVCLRLIQNIRKYIVMLLKWAYVVRSERIVKVAYVNTMLSSIY